MTFRSILILTIFALATPALAGGHPNGKQKEFYATQRQPGKVSADHTSTGSIAAACVGKSCRKH